VIFRSFAQAVDVLFEEETPHAWSF
jgi:hypothetical protein